MIIFDWDGTLMDSSDTIVRCFVASANEMALPEPDPDQVKRYIGLSLEESFYRLYPGSNPDMISQLIDGYRENWLSLDSSEMSFFDGVGSGLKQLEGAGYLLAIATGKSRRGLDRVLIESGINDLFVTSRCADESRSKPHPQMLLDILDYTGMNTDQCIMVGDTTFDLEMAKSAGIHGMGVGYGSHPTEELSTLTHHPIAMNFPQLVRFFV